MLKKAIILQNNPYRLPENRLAEYHGAIFAEEFRRHGVDATKMVLGDPEKDKPISPLLSVSSMNQRLSTKWWQSQAADLVIFYGGQDVKNIPVMRAIKEGLPNSKLILKMDAAYGPLTHSVTDIKKSIAAIYTKTRHGHWKHGKDGAIPGSFATAAATALIKTALSQTPRSIKKILSLFERADFVSYENASALTEAQHYCISHNRSDLATKIIWVGYPVRRTYLEPRPKIARKPASIISIANWKHAKDLGLHAAALAEVFRRHSTARFTLIGNNSSQLLDMIVSTLPSAAGRIEQINEISNQSLPDYLFRSQVFMLCSFSEGICSAVIEALCAGCSAALSTGIGVPCFTEFVADDCGTQANTRSVADMANAVLSELDLWKLKKRDPNHIRQIWSRTLVPNLCEHICEVTGFQLP